MDIQRRIRAHRHRNVDILYIIKVQSEQQFVIGSGVLTYNIQYKVTTVYISQLRVNVHYTVRGKNGVHSAMTC